MKSVPYNQKQFERSLFVSTAEQIDVINSQLLRDSEKTVSKFLENEGITYANLPINVKSKIGYLPKGSKIPRNDGKGRYEISGIFYFLGFDNTSVKFDFISDDLRRNGEGQNFGKSNIFFPEALMSGQDKVYLTVEPITALKYLSNGKMAAALLYNENVDWLDRALGKLRDIHYKTEFFISEELQTKIGDFADVIPSLIIGAPMVYQIEKNNDFDKLPES